MMIDCNDSDERLADSDLPTRFADANTAAPFFGSFLVAVASLCRQWPTPEAPLGVLRGQGAAPVLVVGGVDDPVAPYVGAQAVAIAARVGDADLLPGPHPRRLRAQQLRHQRGGRLPPRRHDPGRRHPVPGLTPRPAAGRCIDALRSATRLRWEP